MTKFYRNRFTLGSIPQLDVANFQIDTNKTLKISLVSYYKLENINDKFNSNNLTNTGSATFTTGKVNNCVEFSSAGQYLHTTNQWLSSMSIFSFSFWAYISGTSLSGCFVSNGRRDNISGNGVQVGVGGSGTSGNFGNTGNQLIVSCGGVAWQPTGSNIGTGWHHIIVTRDGTTMNAYIDNIQTPTLTNSTATPTTPTNGSFIGTSDNGVNTNYQFIGKVDEFGIWSKVLSTQERADLYNSYSGQTLI